ncbi:hypothetical protein GDO86_009575 [Hymenochirus boettgeri]|uniref:Ensconsin n=1 Tax=Hymenochirus boettgeri TaxID=247094 RepID=A0A8T2JGM1_9PIPI|nr:hypothetical protein GDO86_009575 [Hymenochirus boettgeri]
MGGAALLDDITTVMAERQQQEQENPDSIPVTDSQPAGPDGSHSKLQEKKNLSRSMSAMQGQLGKDNAGFKSEPHLLLKVDERQRLARERREEREKHIAARESLWLEKEERARQHYEKHLEERKKRLEEQRIKEERRRAAVDEKRKLKLEEEKERHEAVLKRTMERSHKPKQKTSRWSWGGALQSSTSVNNSDPDRRSVSTMNLSKHVDPVINKRLSTSYATLLNSPDKGRRPPLSTWESSVVSRLLTPTHSYLARSRSTVALSGDAASCSPLSPQTNKLPSSKSAEKPKLFITTPETTARRKTTHFAGTSSSDKKEKEREYFRENIQVPPASNIKRSHSPSNPKVKSASSFHVGTPPKLPASSFSVAKPASSFKLTNTIQFPLLPGNVRPIKRDIKVEGKKKDEDKEPNGSPIDGGTSKEQPTAEQSINNERELMSPSIAEASQDAAGLPPVPTLQSPTAVGKPFAGTTDPEQATRILAEKRRLAREQRERDEEEKRQKIEEERIKKEELARRQAEERARREEEMQRTEAERKQKEEEELQERESLLAEEKERKEQEELERLQKQKEEAERIRVEREKHFQKEEQERSERKKRLEEIMKRTRRSEANEKQSSVQRNGEIPKAIENTVITPAPLQEHEPELLLNTTENPHNGESVVPSTRIITVPDDSSEKQPNENGLSTKKSNFEEIINLPVGTKPILYNPLKNEGSSVQTIPLKPIIAFEEEATHVSLPQVDNTQTAQTAEVI